MRLRPRLACVLLCVLLASSAAQTPAAPPARETPGAGGVPSPSQFLGFTVGADRQLADYRQISSYLRALDAASPRVEIEEVGKTTLGNDMLMAVISTPENLRNKQRYQEIARQLNNPQEIKPGQVESLVRDGKTILLITCNIHSTEIGASQMAMEWAFDLATTQDAKKLRWLNDVIVLLVPSLNPDGQIMVTEWYRKNLGTRYEGGALPWLYHPYVGHDNNRDWYMLTQKETRALNRAVYHRWFPQIWLDEHQMGTTGPRIFMPPYADPIAESLNPIIFRNINVIGTNMALRLEQQGKTGAIYGYQFDAYWPGGTRNTAWWKNIFGLLTEVASARIASPVNVSATELSGGAKGLVEYKKQINFPSPWPGGVWRMRNVMDYELIISDAALETASVNREDFLRGTARLAAEAIAAAPPGEAYRIPRGQRDPVAAARLAHLLREHGVRVLLDGNAFLVPLAQPYGRFVEEMFSVQRYPEIKPVAGPAIMPPYDVAAWSLPLMMGVVVEKVNLPAVKAVALKENEGWPQGSVSGSGGAWLLDPGSNASAALLNEAWKSGAKVSVLHSAADVQGRRYPAGTYLITGGNAAELARKHHVSLQGVAAAAISARKSTLNAPRVGLYKPFTSSMDEGWTRWVLEQYGFNSTSLDNKTIKAGNLRASFDAIILPDLSKESILDGRSRGRGEMGARYVEELPAEFAGGTGREGISTLKQFVEQGGTIITLATSSQLLIDEFNIPVRNALAGSKPEEFLQPGSLVRVRLDSTHPVAYGMPHEVAGFLDESLAFQTSPPGPELSRDVVGWYPADEQDILLSGWMRGGERLERRAAIVALRSGKGKLVLFGIRPQHRAQTEATFRLLFNALYWSAME